MTEWTSLSVTKEQKEQIVAEKPEGMSMGEFLVSAIVDGEVTVEQVDIDPIVDQLRNELSMVSDPTVSPDVDGMMERIDSLQREVKKAQELAEQARDEAQQVKGQLR